MKPIISIILVSSFLLFGNHTLVNAIGATGSNCGFTEAMTILDKYSGDRDIFKQASECLENMGANDPLASLVKGRILVKNGFSKNDEFSKKAMAEATKYYEQAIDLAPEDYEVNYYSALFYGDVIRDEKKAQKHFAKISENPLNRERTLYVKMVLPPDSDSEKENLAHHFSESPVFIHKHQALKILTRIYWKSDHDLVEMAYKEILRNGKKHDVNMAWDYLNYAGFLTYQKREFDKAAEMMDISRSLMKFGMQDIYDAEIAYRRGYQYVWKVNPREYGKGVTLLEESVKLNRKHKYAYYSLAIACYYQGMKTGNKELVYKAKKYLQTQQKQNASYGEGEKYMAMINRTISQIENQN